MKKKAPSSSIERMIGKSKLIKPEEDKKQAMKSKRYKVKKHKSLEHDGVSMEIEKMQK